MTIQSMAEALAARDAGVQSSANHAETDAPGWQDEAYGWLVGWVSTAMATTPFTMEQFRTACEAFGMPQPSELRAYGALTVRAIRSGLIERVGFAPAASSHGSPKALYNRRLTRNS